MYHHYSQPQQQQAHYGARVTPAQASDLMQQHSTSEIEAFRARQRMQLRYGHTINNNNQQQVFPFAGSSSNNNNQTDAHYCERMHDADDDNRVRKLSLAKRRQHVQHQPQSLPGQPRVVQMPNFGGGARQFDALQSDACADMSSPVPFASHAMFNAFDYGHAPETFGDVPQSHSHHALGSDSDEKSLWRRRFADAAAHARRSPKLGKVALWDSPCGLDESNQLSHELQHIHPYFSHHQHLYEMQ